ncbi:hypothetical protein F9802_11890 [Bacillus aerolatus]|uniref:MFS transporter n=1 Tax=Bacillus aerolatus TaxID=2653354 RepID=A0A6I1FIT4_9BACI|nr:hypothetical protein F9802_11890 [Bacillus aerolatus]
MLPVTIGTIGSYTVIVTALDAVIFGLLADKIGRKKPLYGTSKEAVLNQVYLAMIVYCLTVLAQISKYSILLITRWLKELSWKPCESC